MEHGYVFSFKGPRGFLRVSDQTIETTACSAHRTRNQSHCGTSNPTDFAIIMYVR